MNLAQGLKMAWKSISTSKLRSFLTMLGIIIGVGSIIALITIGQGAVGEVTKQIKGMGAKLLTVNVFGSDLGITLEDVDKLGKKNGVFAIAPVLEGRATVKYGTKNKDVPITGITPEYAAVQNYSIETGRFIVPIDTRYRQKVALIGSKTARHLFGTADPVGKSVLIDGSRFKIVGLLQEKGSTGSNDDKIMIPIASAERLLKSKRVSTVYIQANSPGEIDGLKTELETDLRKTFKPSKEGIESFSVVSQKEMLKSVDSITGTMTLALGGIAGISLLVGGIGVMNIMLVTVSERTREIGIRKAIGARRRDIVFQFLIESMVLGGIGGIIGIGTGIGIAMLASKIMNIEAFPSIKIILLAFGFSLGIGVFFGWFPANKAAKMKPIDALKSQ
ncbi:ABC transporter permease [Paenibacillus marchantiophytorum]|uniref:ABC transporter permease n=1 Tax=Paenibacillus marchantiophytorum TaxID=1619310 RepID=A0ABQ1EKT8_9BACL|nr:ABC transporter permease [Paenibacillus marchantiophytorum]GFZ75840.1 ABC transporter permease [Paenibacillus marchantiophytorum]